MDASCFGTLSPRNIYMFFIIVIILGVADSYEFLDDLHYTNCSPPFVCGPARHITYPFWGNLRASYCGTAGFELGCQDDEYAFMDFKGQWYRVLEIDQRNHVMTAARNDLWDSPCLQDRIWNTTMDNSTLFDYPASVKNVTIFYCSNPDPTLSTSLDQTPCPLEFYPNRAAVFVDGEVVDLMLSEHPQLNGCNEIIKVPVLRSALNEFARGLSTDWARVLERGFELSYTVDQQCLGCELSGGVCGTNSSSPGGFVCYCSDRPYSKNCLGSGGSKVSLEIGIGVVVGGVVLSVPIILYLWKRLWPILFKVRKSDRDIENFIKHNGSLAPERFSYSQVKRMTNSFRGKLGEGGFGAVYSGKLHDGTPVAVKLLNASKGNGEGFINEVASISRTSHINIVTLLGFCYEGHRRALIYEFMSKGSLHKFIADENALTSGTELGWEKLHQIAAGIARGLEYLHKGCNTRILHFDIKPQNILLDDEFNLKILDFGLSKLCLKRESVVSMMIARGTFDYIAPEVFTRNFGDVSHKSDVYSYGMVLLEMVGGRKKNLIAEADQSSDSEMYFYDEVYQLIEEEYDQSLYGEFTEEDKQTAKKMALVGIWCIQAYPKQRPSMGKVIEMLEGSVEALPTPQKPSMSSPPRPLINSSSISVSL